MRRIAIVAVLLGVACAAAEDDKDPVRDKLFAAKVAHDKETAAFRKSVTGWMDKREDVARKAGDKKAIDQIKADRTSFDEDGVLPKTVPLELKQKHERMNKALETAYAEAVKAYTKARNDERATAVDQEWKDFSAKANGLDLLALADPKAHPVSGEWKKEKTALVGVSDAQKRGLIQLPYEPGEEYDLEVKCKRLSGGQYLTVGLVAGGRQVEAVIEEWPQQGGKSGFTTVDGKTVENNETTVKGQFLKNNQTHALVYSVRNEKIDVTLDGKPFLAFKGEFNRLASTEYSRVPNKKALFIMVGSSAFQFDSIVVKLVKGKGTILK